MEITVALLLGAVALLTLIASVQTWVLYKAFQDIEMLKAWNKMDGGYQ